MSLEKQRFEYDPESDVLDVYFGAKRPAWTIELTENITISVDREARTAVSLCLLDFSKLIEPTPFGPRRFPITDLADLPLAERDLVLELLNAPPVDSWLDVSAVQSLPDSPFAVTHLESPPREVLDLLPAVA